ncbi:hypothetical protein DRO56_01060 [Candidatus Bathyarchaeota archaeon]|nr:MAG: hypothetical protein CW700_02475 [Candidatus Bathyarchaeota archaeon]RLI33719.1 MAG: hypothetical protein DRO56_01060 [Candidatus Bathyarchaeota archaeon]
MAHSYIQLLSTVLLYSMPHRQLEGFTHALHRLVSQLPPGDYSGLRKRILALNPRPVRDAEERWRTCRYSYRPHRGQGAQGRRLGRVETRQEEAIREAPLRSEHRDKGGGSPKVSTDDTHDVVSFPKLMKVAPRRS